MAKSVNEYLKQHDDWQPMIGKLRELLTALPFEETVKWGMPTYCVDGRNAVSIGAFKNHLALWFHDGADLPDPDDVLVNAQPGKTKSMRHLRFQREDRVPVTRVKRYLKAALEHAQQN